MEEISIEKIDIVRERYKISYLEAKEALQNNNGNLVDTLIFLEKSKKDIKGNIQETTNDLIETIKEIIRKGNVNRIKVKKDEKVLVDIPVNAGIITSAIALFNPVLIAVGAVSAMVSKVTLEIERPNGQVDIINDIVKNKYEDIKKNVDDTTEDLKNKTENTINNIKEKVNNTDKNSNNNCK